MSNTYWEPASVKAQLRLTTLRLGQLQEKKDSQGAIIRRDIATLLQQRNVGLARAKAQNLQKEDALGDLLEVLEMHVGQLLEHFNELDQSTNLTPNIIEAASTVIYAAPHVGLKGILTHHCTRILVDGFKDLEVTSNILTQRLGSEFMRAAVANRDGRVASIAIRTTADLSPSAQNLDLALQKIASEYSVKWTPEPLRQDILNPLSEILDPQASPTVDLPRLRRLCRHGIPDEPQWLRPRIWKLFLGILPENKASWAKNIQVQRDSYYVGLTRFEDMTHTHITSRIWHGGFWSHSQPHQLSSIPSILFGDLVQAPGSFDICPLDDDANNEVKLGSAKNLDIRLHTIRTTHPNQSSIVSTPTTRPESATASAPEISLSSPDVILSGDMNGSTTTLFSSKPLAASTVHPKHLSALLRLLYLHASINPGNISPHIPSLLVPLYTVLNQEVIPEDLAHVEADTFWLFEAIVGEFSELEDEEGGSIWMKRFSERLAWADSDLFNALTNRLYLPGLSQWLAPLLTHTLPLPSVLPVWDALFSCPMRTRDVNPKVDHLLDVCTSLLTRARAALFRLGKNGRKSPSLWAEEKVVLPPPSPLRAWELGDAFLEGMAFLQLYPVEAAGGIDRILQGAFELGHRRDEEAKAAQNGSLSLGARIKVTMWKGFTNQDPSPDTSPEESEDDLSDEDVHEDGNDTETGGIVVPGLTSRLATTVWRGITNQTSMEPPPSPNPPLSPSGVDSEPIQPPYGGNPNTPSSLWGYADKFKGSDTAAAIAKVSSNWRARSILGSWGRSSSTSDGKDFAPLAQTNTQVELDSDNKEASRRRSSLSLDRSGVYSPPPRPQYFRRPRDSFVFPHNAVASPEQEVHHEGLTDKTRSLQSSLAALTRSSPTPSQAAAKPGPRPLLLSPSTSLTSPPSRPLSRSAGSTPTPDRGQWADVMRLKGHSPHRESMSSISSLSPSDALRSAHSGRSDWDSDTGTSSRRIPLNRKSVSPMAPGFRARQGRPISGTSSATSSERGLLSPPPDLSDQTDLQNWSHLETPGSPVTSPLALKSLNTHNYEGGIQLIDPGPSAMNISNEMAPKKPLRKIVQTPFQDEDTSDSSVALAPSRSPRLRSKRYGPRPLDLEIQTNSSSHTRPTMERKSSNSNSLGVDWPSDDHEIATTPRASSFGADDSATPSSSKSLRRSRKASTETQERSRKTSTDMHETQVRKLSSGQRPRKLSNDQKEAAKRRDSSAEEGDDEGYDDLLSAYESENSQVSSLR
ncbi:hypothetical protein DXG01_014521 [Tephrocybe rancida]|nr:hypothetical protein DXG01_014521 [Tephrocybe rancida]